MTTTTTSDLAEVEAERDQLRRGSKELGKVIAFLADLIKDAYLRGADDPIDAMQMLGDCLAEVLEGEGGLSPDDFNRVYRALEVRRDKAAKDHDELRDKRTDLLNIRGILSPQDRSPGLGPVVPMPLGKEVAPAVERLVNEVDQLREENLHLRGVKSAPDVWGDARPLTDTERAFQDGV